MSLHPLRERLPPSRRQLRRRHVHTELQAGQTEALPAPAIFGGLLEDPFADGDDQTRRFKRLQEAAWLQDSSSRVMPAQQRLGAQNPVRHRIVLRLVVQLELACVEGLPDPIIDGVALNRTPWRPPCVARAQDARATAPLLSDRGARVSRCRIEMKTFADVSCSAAC